jgi:hypothetical protein
MYLKRRHGFKCLNSQSYKVTTIVYRVCDCETARLSSAIVALLLHGQLPDMITLHNPIGCIRSCMAACGLCCQRVVTVT